MHIHHHHHHYGPTMQSSNGYHSHDPCGCAQQMQQCSQHAMGRPNPMGSTLGGIVGAILGQMLLPIPGLGALIGGLLGALFGGAMGGLFASSASGGCCCHNMNQYGPSNANMGAWMGFPPTSQSCCFPPQRFGHLPQHHFHHSLPEVRPHRHVAPRVERHQHHEHSRLTVQTGTVGEGARVEPTLVQEPEHRQPHAELRGEVEVQAAKVEAEAVVAPRLEQRVEDVETATVSGEAIARTEEVGPRAEVAPAVEQEVEADEVANVSGVAVAETGPVAPEATVAPAVLQEVEAPEANVEGIAVARTEEVGQGARVAPEVVQAVEADEVANVSGVAVAETGPVAPEATVAPAVLQEVEAPEANVEGITIASTGDVAPNARVAPEVVQAVEADEVAVVTGSAQAVTGDVAGTVQPAVTQEVESEGSAVSMAEASATVESVAPQGRVVPTVVQETEAEEVAVQDARVEVRANGEVEGEVAPVVEQDASARVVEQRAEVEVSGAPDAVATVEQTGQGGLGGVVEQEVVGGDAEDHVEQDAATLGGRVLQDVDAGADDDVVTQTVDNGVLGVLAPDSDNRVALGSGDDTLTIDGNAGDNALRISTGDEGVSSDRDEVTIEAGSGDDTTMIELSRDQDRYQLDSGRGDDRLIVTEGDHRTRIVDGDGEVLYQSDGWTEEDSIINTDRTEAFTVYREDGSYARWNERDGLQIRRDPPSDAEMTPVEAARILRSNMDYMDTAAGVDDRDGIVGRPDLEAMARNEDTPAELRGAIDYMLENDAAWRSLDASGARSNRIDLEGLNNYIDRFETSPGFEAGPMNDRRAAEVLRHYMPVLDTAQSQGNDNAVFNLDDARAITRDNPGLPPELRAATEHLLESDGLRRDLDRASGMFNWISDDAYSEDDLNAYLR